MKKAIALVLMLLILVSPAAYATVELEMVHWMNEQAEGVNAAIEAFNSSQSDIHVNVSIIPWSQYWEKLIVALPAGAGPDVFAINMANLADYAPKSYLLDISELFKSGAVDLSKFPQHVIQGHSSGGVLWGVPKDYDCICVFYNKGMFDAAGVAYPSDDWSWDEFVATATKLTNAEANVYGVAIPPFGQQIGYDYIFGNGGRVFNENGDCAINSPESAEALQRLYDVIHVSNASPTVDMQVETNADTMFMSGMIAMNFQGSWMMDAFAKVWGDKLGVAPLPVMKERKTISHCLSWVSSSATKHPTEAMKLLEFLGTYDAQAKSAPSVIPAYAGTEKLWADAYPNYNVNAVLDAVPKGWAVPLPIARKNSQEFFTTFDSGMADMLAMGDIPNALAKLQDDLNALLK